MVLQGKLLKIIEEKRLRRLGAVVDYAVNIKLIAAITGPEARVADGRFHIDLYHRLAVEFLEFPPLRARGEVSSCWPANSSSITPQATRRLPSVCIHRRRRGSYGVSGRVMYVS